MLSGYRDRQERLTRINPAGFKCRNCKMVVNVSNGVKPKCCRSCGCGYFRAVKGGGV